MLHYMPIAYIWDLHEVEPHAECTFIVHTDEHVFTLQMGENKSSADITQWLTFAWHKRRNTVQKFIVSKKISVIC